MTSGAGRNPHRKMILKQTILCLLAVPMLQAQEFSFTYDHFALEVADLQKVGDYYRQVLLLEEIPHPSEPEGFRWFRISGNAQLHLIGKETVPREDRKSEHLCLSVSDLDAFIAHLAVATNAGQLKVGSFARSERMVKWNEVLRIERELKANARFLGAGIFDK